MGNISKRGICSKEIAVDIDVLPRVDKVLPDGSAYTSKLMDTGELRTRIVHSDGFRTSRTRSPDWELTDVKSMPWQDSHYHVGLTEVYMLISDWAYFIWLNGEVPCSGILETPGQSKLFLPRVPHVVLLGPSTEIQTTSFGESVGNPQRDDSDWWDVTPDFYLRVWREINTIEMVVRAKMSPVQG
jgi:hypothetical protein